MRRLGWLAALVGVGVCSIPFWHAVPSHAKASPVAAAPGRPPVPVDVARVTRQDVYNEITYEAEFRPYVEVDLHAKVSGYVQQMNVDFGDRVKAGQLLATLEVPELLDELHNAMATEQKAEADHTAAHLDYTRWLATAQDAPGAVAQQDLDAARARDQATAAAIAAAKADREKYETLVSYTKITAPFEAVITKRYVDPGALIQAGTASVTQSLPLVRVSDNYRLRLDFPVSVPQVKDIHLGDPVEVRVESLGGEPFAGTITRTTDRVDSQTRKMTTEIEVPNPDLELVPGMYATVVLKVGRRPMALTVPTEAVTMGKQPTVNLVNDRDQIEERPVTLGLETPTRLEVLDGLKEGDLVMIGSPARLQPGQKVAPRRDEALAQAVTPAPRSK